MLQGASPTTPTSAASSIFVDAEDSLLLGSDDDGMANELAELEKLRRSVKKNLLLRPLSTQNLRASAASSAATSATASNTPSGPETAKSPDAKIPGSYPFTPAAHSFHQQLREPPHSAASTASDVFYSARPLSNASFTAYYFEENKEQLGGVKSPGTAAFMPPGGFPMTPWVPGEGISVTKPLVASPPSRQTSSTSNSSSSKDPGQTYQPAELLELLQFLNYPTSSGTLRPLLLDTRPSGSYLASRLIYSINLSIPSLILKRHRKALLKGGNGFTALESLKGYISTDSGKKNWESLMDGSTKHASTGGLWNGEIIVFDEDMDETDPLAPTNSQVQNGSTPSTPGSISSTTSNLSTPSSSAWNLLTLLQPLSNGPIYYLKGGITALRKLEGSEEVVVSGEWEIEEDSASDDGEGSDAAASSDTMSTTGVGQSVPTTSSMPTSISTSSSSEMNITPRGANGLPTASDKFKFATSSPSLKNLATSSPRLPLSVSGSPNPRGLSQGLFSIRTDVAAKHKPLPELEPPTTSPKLAADPKASSEDEEGQVLHTGSQTQDSTTPMSSTFNAGQTSTSSISRGSSSNSLTVDAAEGRNATGGNPVLLRPPPSPRRAATFAGLSDAISPDANRTPQGLTLLTSSITPSARREFGHTKNNSVGSDGSTPQSVKTPPSAIDLKSLPIGDGRRPPALHIPSLSGHGQGGSGQGLGQEQRTPPQRPRLAKLDMTSTERLKSLAQIEGNHKANGAPGPPKLQLKTARSNTVATDTVDAQAPIGGGEGRLPKLKIPLNKLSLTTTQQNNSNVLIVNTPSSPENSTSYVNVKDLDRDGDRPPPSPSGQFAGGLGAPPRPRTPKSPLTPLLPPSPLTARPGNNAEPTSPAPVFTISTILPGFLYLGPELVKEEHATELEGLGVKRILNIAIECDDDADLGLRTRFEKYIRIPMRDTVEEVNVAKAMKEVCEILDDARLHSSPTYVHCKAGKSRSVTAVMAYLIHANHWTLSRAYAFVLDRRKGISPNIGFVSELMNFEEEELGGKSVGVVGGQTTGTRRGHHHHRNVSKTDGSSTARRKAAHLRESMPPIVQSYSAIATVGEHDSFSGGIGGTFPTSGNGSNQGGEMVNGQLMSAGPMGKGPGLRDVGEEMEVRDAEGRYRHARRAPVDELTLQPVRRVSKAGLETWANL